MSILVQVFDHSSHPSPSLLVFLIPSLSISSPHPAHVARNLNTSNLKENKGKKRKKQNSSSDQRLPIHSLPIPFLCSPQLLLEVPLLSPYLWCPLRAQCLWVVLIFLPLLAPLPFLLLKAGSPILECLIKWHLGCSLSAGPIVASKTNV